MTMHVTHAVRSSVTMTSGDDAGELTGDVTLCRFR